MSTNFSYLAKLPAYKSFASTCLEAEQVLATSVTFSIVACRKAAEQAVKWVYAAEDLTLPFRPDFSTLIHEPDFKTLMDFSLWNKINLIRKLGNEAAHNSTKLVQSDGILALSSLYEFVKWIEYCYGENYDDVSFSENKLPLFLKEKLEEKLKKQYEREEQHQQTLEVKEKELRALRAQLEALNPKVGTQKAEFLAARVAPVSYYSEKEAREKLIDVDLRLMGWTVGDTTDHTARTEVPLTTPKGNRKADYVLYGKNGKPVAVVEAKKTARNPSDGKAQALEYADALEQMDEQRPIMFYTNGLETWLWNDLAGEPPRRVSSVFPLADLERMIARRGFKKDLLSVPVKESITNRYYQKDAIKAVAEKAEKGVRKHLLVMATGTGKTRTACSIVDVFSRGGQVTNVLFLADRISLVNQAHDAFQEHLPEMSRCNLPKSKEHASARIVFSTYPTILNAVDTVTAEDGIPLYSPGHFDLIIIDEAHRSIFKKYKAIFEYFDGILLGLTATPSKNIDRNTYDFFELEQDLPTAVYERQLATFQDNYLVPFYTIESSTRIIDEGIYYDKLTEEEKEEYETELADEYGNVPEHTESEKINSFIFNQQTIDLVITELMTMGIRLASGDLPGKTIIFAQNQRHAAYIVERMDILYPQYGGKLAARIVSSDSRAQELIGKFKETDDYRIAVSVDMMDTGLDIPEVVNLVFFKRVRSVIKFWQMIGRGTRLCPDLTLIDSVDGTYQDKRRFYIFDYLGNFEFFREKPDGKAGGALTSISESIFTKRVGLVYALQESAFSDEEFRELRDSLVSHVLGEITALNPERMPVHLQRAHVAYFSNESAWTKLTAQQFNDLKEKIAPLPLSDEKVEDALILDNIAYRMMQMFLECGEVPTREKNSILRICEALESKQSIPRIKENIAKIKEINTTEYWDAITIKKLEELRLFLRDYMEDMVEDSRKIDPKFLHLEDESLEPVHGKAFDVEEEYLDYKMRVNHYIEKNKNHLAIHKLRYNLPLTSMDFSALEEILMKDLGSPADYQSAFGSTPLGLLVRRTAKMDRESAYSAFSSFIDDQSLSQNQIHFVKRIIEYILENGYIEDISVLSKTPFDRPAQLFEMFKPEEVGTLWNIINTMNNNALQPQVR